MSKVRDLETVVRYGLCTSCGLCESMAGRDRVEMVVSATGHLRPKVKTKLEPALLGRILAVCPGAGVTGPSAAEGQPMHPKWGPLLSLQRSWAASDAVRHKAAAGGTLTALGAYLLDSGKVEAVVHVRASTSDPITTDSLVSRSAQDVISGAQSRYATSSPLRHVMRLLDEGTRFAVIGKPCDVAAIRALGRIDTRVSKQIPYLLTIFCGGEANLQTAEKIAAFHGVPRKDIALFRWRGEGWPGPTRVSARDGRVFDMSYEETWYEKGKPWTYDLQFRCKICPDAIGEQADVAVPDGWVIENGKRIFREAPGVNVAVARTDAGVRLLRDASAAGALKLTPCSFEDFEIMHNDHTRRKVSHPARALALFLLGQPNLRIRRYRAWQAMRLAGLGGNWTAFWGMVRRVLERANREPLPR